MGEPGLLGAHPEELGVELLDPVQDPGDRHPFGPGLPEDPDAVDSVAQVRPEPVDRVRAGKAQGHPDDGDTAVVSGSGLPWRLRAYVRPGGRPEMCRQRGGRRMLEEGRLRDLHPEPLLQPRPQPYDEDGGQAEFVERRMRVGRAVEEGGEFLPYDARDGARIDPWDGRLPRDEPFPQLRPPHLPRGRPREVPRRDGHHMGGGEP